MSKGILKRIKDAFPAKLINRCAFSMAKTYRGNRALVILVGAISVLTALEPIVTLWIGKQILDSIQAYFTTIAKVGKADAASLLRTSLGYIGLECLVALATTGLQQYSGYLSMRLSQQVGFQMRQEIYEHCLQLDYGFFESPQSQDVLFRCQSSTGQVLSIFNSILRLGSMVVTMVASLVALFSFNVYLGLIAFVSALPNFFLNARLTKERYDVFFKRSDRSRRGSLYGMLLMHPMFVKDTVLLGIGRFFFDKWKDTESQTVLEDIRINAKQTWIQLAMQWLNRIVTACAYGAVVILSAATKGGTIGAVTMNIGLFRQAQGQVQGLSDLLASLNNSIVFLEDYFNLMNAKSSIKVLGEAHINGEPIRSIEFQNVSFAYPGSPKKALENVSFRLNAGESAFLAGRNGAGKTSLIKLLMRLYEPTEGMILLNGRPIQEFEPELLRRKFSVLMQDYSKYPFTARENIQFGDINNASDSVRIEQAVDASRFREIVSKLPDGLDTYLMRMFGGPKGGSNGHDLSGGEWQKLALARSFFRQSSVFILDEPTSNLDVQSESEILGYFKEHVRDKIAIIVSHRLSAAAVADKVVFVEGGKIVEEGLHNDLIRGDGPYASLFRLQQSGFSFL